MSSSRCYDAGAQIKKICDMLFVEIMCLDYKQLYYESIEAKLRGRKNGM